MESFVTVQENTQEKAVAVNIRLSESLNARIEDFADRTVRTKTHAITYLVLRGFEALAERGEEV